MTTPKKKQPHIKGITSPIKRSADRLIAALESYSGVTGDTKQAWAMEMVRLPTFPYLNMNTLASALILIHYSEEGNNPIPPETFKELVDQLIDQTADPKVQQRERENILRYIFHIQLFRSRSLENLPIGIPTNVFEPSIKQGIEIPEETEGETGEPEEPEEQYRPYEVFEEEE